MKYGPVHYHDYLHLKTLLNSQNRRSEELGQPAHDEMLFIIVHQTYELWFKQILFEIDSALKILRTDKVDDSLMGALVHRLERVVSIQKFINGQIDVLETMTPLDFLDFRDFLYPASGFQSFQWRCLETKLGLKIENRHAFNNSPFYKMLSDEQQTIMLQMLSEPSLFDLVEKWLERTPFMENSDFNFWNAYEKSVRDLFANDREVVRKNPRLSEEERKKSLDMIDSSEKGFDAILDINKYNEYKSQGQFRLSHKAIRAALLIQLYRDRPILQMPFRLIQSLLDIDEHMTQWRYRHSTMTHRMLGKKIGTGGSSGHDYLRAATEKHKIFTDFFNLTTFFLPRSLVPPLPKSLETKMSFDY